MKTKSDFQVGEVISVIRWEGPFISTYKGGRGKKRLTTNSNVRPRPLTLSKIKVAAFVIF